MERRPAACRGRGPRHGDEGIGRGESPISSPVHDDFFFLFSPSCELLPLASLWNARSWRDHRIVANDLEAKDCNGLTHDYIATDHHVTTNVASLSNGRVVANFDAIAYHDQCRPDVVRGLY